MKHSLSLDQFFGSALRNYESPVPEDLFDRIMGERRKQKAGFWYRTGGKMASFSLILLLAGISGQSPTSKKSVTSSQNLFIPSYLPVEITPVTATGPIASISRNTGGNENAPSEKVLICALKRKDQNGLLPALPAIENQKTADVKITDKAALADKNKLGVHTPNLSYSSSLFGNGASQNGVPEATGEAATLNSSHTTIDRAEYSETLQLENKRVIPVYITPEISKLFKELRPVIANNKDSLTLQNLIAKMAKPGPGLGCPSFTSRNTLGNEGWYFDLYGSPELAMREFKDRNSENSPYAKARDSMERPWYAFSAGMRASYVFNSGFAIRAGLIYAQNNEVFTYNNPAETRVITVIDSIFDASGKLTGTQTKQEKVIGVHSKITYNRYRTIDIPVQIGYEWGQGENNSWSVNGGANLNILTWRKADILGPDYLPLSVTSNFDQKNTNYKSTTGISLYASVAYYHLIGETTQLMIEPHITYGLSSLTNDNYPISQRYTNLGLIVGLRWKL